MSETSEDPKKYVDPFRPRATRICKGEEPPPKDRSDIGFLVRKAQIKKADGDLLIQRATKLETALQAIRKEILMTQGAVDSFVDLISELLEDQDSDPSKDPPQELTEAPTAVRKGPPQE